MQKTDLVCHPLEGEDKEILLLPQVTSDYNFLSEPKGDQVGIFGHRRIVVVRFYELRTQLRYMHHKRHVNRSETELFNLSFLWISFLLSTQSFKKEKWKNLSREWNFGSFWNWLPKNLWNQFHHWLCSIWAITQVNFDGRIRKLPPTNITKDMS